MIGKMPFDWQKDLALLTLVARVPEVLAVHPSVGVATLAELVAYARARPGPEASRIWRANCSRPKPRSTSCTFPIAAPLPR